MKSLMVMAAAAAAVVVGDGAAALVGETVVALEVVAELAGAAEVAADGAAGAAGAGGFWGEPLQAPNVRAPLASSRRIGVRVWGEVIMGSSWKRGVGKEMSRGGVEAWVRVTLADVVRAADQWQIGFRAPTVLDRVRGNDAVGTAGGGGCGRRGRRQTPVRG
jgi:hypothetical protein